MTDDLVFCNDYKQLLKEFFLYDPVQLRNHLKKVISLGLEIVNSSYCLGLELLFDSSSNIP